MANRWGNNGKSDRLLFLWAPKSLQMVTATMKLKMLAPWKKSYDQLSTLKSRDITLPTKFCLVKAMVFPVVDGSESWTIKKTESQRIGAFELWCWRKLLRVLGLQGANQSVLKEMSPFLNEQSALNVHWKN